MANTNDKAEEVLNKGRASKTSQHWGHNSLEDDEVLGAHWDSSSGRKKGESKKDSAFDDSSHGDHHGRNNTSDLPTASKNRPRSKNRRPDAAVYVPRARRSKDTAQPEVHENEMKDASAKPAEGESKSKPRRNKAGMEVYVPRPKRLQQSAETEKDKGNTFEENQSNTFQNVESDRTATGDSKELKKFKRRKVKEIKASGDTKDRGRKDTPKSKHEKHRRSKRDQCEEKILKIEPSDHEKHQEQFEDRNFDSDELQNNCANIGDETWEDEMKFYDSINDDHGEMNISVEDKPGANTKEMCLDQPTTAAENQVAKATTVMETIDPSPVQPLAQDIMGTNSDLSVLDNIETDTTNLAEGNNQICDQPVAVETLQTENCTLSKEMAQDKESDSNVKLCFSDRPEAEGELNNLLSVADRTDSEEQPNKRRKSNDGQEESSGVYECDRKIDNKAQTKVDHNDTRTCDGETARVEDKVEAENLKQLSENEMVTEKSTSFPTPSDDTKQNIGVANDDNTGPEIRMPHEDSDPNNQMTQETKVAKNPDDNQISDSCPAESEDGDTWDSLFDDDGEALDPKLMEELTEAVGKVKVQTTQFDYYNYQPKDPDLDDDAYGHLIEIYDFPSELITRDLLAAFREYKDRGFDIKWVDDNHAIGIFSSTIAAQAVLGMKHPLMKVRPISQASRQTKVKAKKCAVFMEPYRPRPETTAAVARSLVTGALGLKSNLTREQRDQERKKLKEAKEKRRQERQQKKDAWDGSFGKCAMDM